MKKVLALAAALVLALSFSVVAFADETVTTPIAISPDNLGTSFEFVSATGTWGDNSLQVVNEEMYTLKLPQNVALDETVVVHIKGTSAEDFRVWLITEGVGTFSNQFKASEAEGFTGGDFDYVIELTAFDKDGKGTSEASEIAVKGPSYGTNLADITVTYLGIFYGTLDEYNAAVEAAAAAPAVEEEAPAASEPVEEAPAVEAAPAPAETAPAAPAKTGVTIMLLPAAIAAVAAVASKRR